MLKKIFTAIKNSIKTSPQDDLELFIVSKNPTSVAEVEHWTKVYDQRSHINISREKVRAFYPSIR